MLKPISTQDLRTLAENAIELVKIVRQWLPVRGDTETKSGSQRTAENWFRLAAEHYTVCERIRNPHKLHFDCRGAYHGPLSCSAAWFEIESALQEIAVAYRLQGVSDESGCPHLPFGQDVPAVDCGTLRRLELAADSILKAVGDEPAAAETPIVASHPLSPLKEKWPREEYARNAIIRLKENPELQSNILAFCRTIADEQGVPEIAGSLKKLLYQEDYRRLWKS